MIHMESETENDISESTPSLPCASLRAWKGAVLRSRYPGCQPEQKKGKRHMRKGLLVSLILVLFLCFSSGVNAEGTAEMIEVGDFSIPVPDGFQEAGPVGESYPDAQFRIFIGNRSGVFEQYLVDWQFLGTEDDDEASAITILSPETGLDTVEKVLWLRANGKPALLIQQLNRYGGENTYLNASAELVLGSSILRLSLEKPYTSGEGTDGPDLFEQIRSLFGEVYFKGAPLEITESEQYLIVAREGEPGDEILAGEPCRFGILGDISALTDAYGPVQWSVRKSWSDSSLEGVSISEDGLLTSDPTLIKENTYIEVEAGFQGTDKKASVFASVGPNPDYIDLSGAVAVDGSKELDRFFGRKYLAYSTIPENLRLNYPWLCEASTHATLGAGYATKADFTYLSGDEKLLEALSFNDRYFHLDMMKLNEPGTVTFLLSAAGIDNSGNVFYLEREYSLCAIAYSGPLLEFLPDPIEITLSAEDDNFDEFPARIARLSDAGRETACTGILINGSYCDDRLPFSVYEYGDHDLNISLLYSGLEYSANVKLHLVPYTISSPVEIYPGDQASVSVLEMIPGEAIWSAPEKKQAEGFTLRVEGDHAALDENNTLRIDPEALPGKTVRIIGERASDGLVLERIISVKENPLETLTFRRIELGDYSVPTPANHLFFTGTPQKNDKGEIVLESFLSSGWGRQAEFVYKLETLPDQPGNKDEIRIEMIQDAETFNPDQAEHFSVNGWQGMALLRRWNHSNESWLGDRIEEYKESGAWTETDVLDCWDALLQFRQDQTRLSLTCKWRHDDQTGIAAPHMTMEKLMEIAKQIIYLGEPVKLGERDPMPEILQAENAVDIIAGGKMQFTVSEASQELSESLGKVEWRVIPKRRTSKLNGITISKDGLLSTRSNSVPDGPVDILVCAKYQSLSDTTVYRLKVRPVLKSFTIDAPQYIFLGQEDAVVEATESPYGALPGHLEWKVDHPEKAEMSVDEEGKLHLKPLQTGKIKITVQNENKKKGNKTITISDNPVLELKIIVRGGKPQAGQKMSFTAEFTPKKPDDRSVTWYAEPYEIAKIDGNGNLKISPAAKPGTEITVTCEANGAPDPVRCDYTFVVE